MAEKVIHLVVEGGVVTDVTHLPDGWLYEVEDHDVEEDSA